MCSPEKPLTLAQKARKVERQRERRRENRKPASPETPEQKARRKELWRARYYADRDYWRKYWRENTQAEKRAAIDILGGACVACGEDDLASLCVDHAKGGGGQERKNNKSKIYGQIIRGRREGLRCLCQSCNHRARADVYGPDISKWPEVVLSEIEALKEFRRALRRIYRARFAS